MRALVHALRCQCVCMIVALMSHGFQSNDVHPGLQRHAATGLCAHARGWGARALCRVHPSHHHGVGYDDGALVVVQPNGTPAPVNDVAIYNLGWNAGACSINTLFGDGHAQFSVTAGTQGAVVGFDGLSPTYDYTEVQFGLYFRNGTFSVIESGVQKGAPAVSATSDVFTIQRTGTTIRYNTSMRVTATEAATRFIQRHAAGEEANSERYLAELGLSSGDVSMKGRDMLLTKQDLDAGSHEPEAEARAVKMRAAFNKWVDGAVLRPDAADVPVWTNNPHYMLLGGRKRRFSRSNPARRLPVFLFLEYAPSARDFSLVLRIAHNSAENNNHI